MSGSTLPTPSSITPRQRGSWVGQGLVDSARGLAILGLVLAEAGLIIALALELSFAIFVYPVLFIPPTLLAVRRLANVVRRLSGQWCGVPIAEPYRGYREPDPGASTWRRFGQACGQLLSEPATWRDLAWMTLDPLLVWVLPFIPITIIAWGLFGVIMPAVWNPIGQAGGSNWYAFIHVTNWLTALLSVPLGIAFIALGGWLAPFFLRWYGQAARSMLAPTKQAALEQQVAHLSVSRAEAVDTGAAEIRRIERDLHDGAQARLVAMGMTLSAAEQMLDQNPTAARALLLEARDSSAKALTELRDLVRGIHPPVLADRGIGEAVRALAMDSPLKIRVTNELPGRPPAPVESASYFAVSELLANASKHAGACQVWIDMRYERGMLRIDVGDDGRGGANPSEGTGLRGIERRLSAFDGILALSSPPGGPTVATMELPCELSSPKTSSF
ncbi:MAG TPA: sensor histidine kinase [Streptosporangiaceae bacterium]|nr:sensor histidine kinase [Streptosporangiaceae bacterium]